MGQFTGRIYSDVELSDALIGEFTQLANKAVHRKETAGTKEFYGDVFVFPDGSTLRVVLGEHSQYAVYNAAPPVPERQRFRGEEKEEGEFTPRIVMYGGNTAVDTRAASISPNLRDGTTGGTNQLIAVSAGGAYAPATPDQVAQYEDILFGVNNWMGEFNGNGVATKVVSWNGNGSRYGSQEQNITHDSGLNNHYSETMTGWLTLTRDNQYPSAQDDYGKSWPRYVRNLVQLGLFYNGQVVAGTESRRIGGAAIATFAGADYFIWVEHATAPDPSTYVDNESISVDDIVYSASLDDPENTVTEVLRIPVDVVVWKSGAHYTISPARHQYCFDPTGKKAVCLNKYYFITENQILDYQRGNNHNNFHPSVAYANVGGAVNDVNPRRIRLTITSATSATHVIDTLVDGGTKTEVGTDDTATETETHQEYEDDVLVDEYETEVGRTRTLTEAITATTTHHLAVDYDLAGVEQLLTFETSCTYDFNRVDDQQSAYTEKTYTNNNIEKRRQTLDSFDESDATTESSSKTGTIKINGAIVASATMSGSNSNTTTRNTTYTWNPVTEQADQDTTTGYQTTKSYSESGEYIRCHTCDLRVGFVQYSLTQRTLSGDYDTTNDFAYVETARYVFGATDVFIASASDINGSGGSYLQHHHWRGGSYVPAVRNTNSGIAPSMYWWACHNFDHSYVATQTGAILGYFTWPTDPFLAETRKFEYNSEFGSFPFPGSAPVFQPSTTLALGFDPGVTYDTVTGVDARVKLAPDDTLFVNHEITAQAYALLA